MLAGGFLWSQASVAELSRGRGYAIVMRHTSLKPASSVRTKNHTNTYSCSGQSTTHVQWEKQASSKSTDTLFLCSFIFHQSGNPVLRRQPNHQWSPTMTCHRGVTLLSVGVREVNPPAINYCWFTAADVDCLLHEKWLLLDLVFNVWPDRRRSMDGICPTFMKFIR